MGGEDRGRSKLNFIKYKSKFKSRPASIVYWSSISSLSNQHHEKITEPHHKASTAALLLLLLLLKLLLLLGLNCSSCLTQYPTLFLNRFNFVPNAL
jgi:hypothetical protein